jgi:uncharacterized membrane protein
MYRGVEPGGPFGPDLQPVHRAVGPLFYIEHVVIFVFFLLVIGLVAFLLYRLLSQSPGGWSGHSTTALRELEMRYARGEIDRDDFLLRRSDLTSPALPPPAVPPIPPPTPPPPTQAPRRASR